MQITKLTRRQMLIGAGGVTAVVGSGGLWLGLRRVNAMLFRRPVVRAQAFAPSVYLAVATSGEVVIWLTKSEMGQGVSTALPMLVADEMDADWHQVRVEQAISGPEFDYGNQFTVASSSVAGEWIQLRRAGATARAMLISAAARQWGISADLCYARDGWVVRHDADSRLSFGALAEAAADEWAPIRPQLKSPAQFHLIGQRVPRVDSSVKSTGAARYGQDHLPPGVRYAVIARSPVPGGKLASVDEAAARQVKGVVDVLKLSNGIAVVADNTWAAMKGRDALVLEWQHADATASMTDLDHQLLEALSAPQAIVAAEQGQVDVRATSFSADYQLPYLAHMCMEPMNCTAEIGSGRCTVWVPTQSPQGARATAARVAALPEENVTVHTTYLGGGFGRRAGQDFVAEAVELASRLEGPVSVVWSRQDDLRHAYYRPATAHRLSAPLGEDGLPSQWLHRIATSEYGVVRTDKAPMTASMGGHPVPYQVPAQRLDWVGVPGPLRTTIWRSVGYSYNTFAIESFVDELAHAAQQDPIAYRLALLNENPLLAQCLSRVAELSQWSTRPGLGVAVHSFGGTHVALVLQVEVRAGVVAAHRAWCVIDCGTVVNPDTVEAQVEGGICDGLSAALFGKVEVMEGEVTQTNFHQYPLARMCDMPSVEVAIVASSRPPSGVGEAALPGVAPALANAAFALTGQRVRRLPFADHDWSLPD